VIYSSTWWQIETAGWQVDESDDATAFVPCDVAGEAALVVSAFRKREGPITAEELWVMSGKASPPTASRQEVRCGDFDGYAATYGDADGVHWRVWWLARNRIHVYATFNCDGSEASKHDAVLDWMLSSLTPLPAAG